MSPTPATIEDIPAELLLKIFHTYIERRQGTGHYHTPDADWRHRRSINLSHVCSVWRAISLGEPALWTDVRLTGVAKLDIHCLQRSRPLPIDLTLSLDGMERKSRSGNCAQLVANRILLQPKQDYSRIRSIRTTHFRDIDVRNMIAFIQKLKLPILSGLFIRTTNPDPPPGSRWGESPRVWQPQHLLRNTLTALELHSRHQTLDGVVVKRAFEVCKSLTSLVVGGLLLEEAPPTTNTTSSRQPPPIRVPSLKRLAVGSPIFKRSDEHTSCSVGCPCPFRRLVADNLEYLELAGGAIGDTLGHLLPLLNSRAPKVGSASTTQASPTVVLNSEFASAPSAYEHQPSLPEHIHLHLVNDTSPALLETGDVDELNVCAWFKATRSTVLYAANVAVNKQGTVRAGRRRLGSYRFLRRQGTVTPILIHPDAKACLHLDDASIEARGWVFPRGEAHGPYLDADQPSIEESDYLFNGYSGQGTSYDSDRDFDWQAFRQDMGWPEGYETPSD